MGEFQDTPRTYQARSLALALQAQEQARTAAALLSTVLERRRKGGA